MQSPRSLAQSCPRLLLAVSASTNDAPRQWLIRKSVAWRTRGDCAPASLGWRQLRPLHSCQPPMLQDAHISCCLWNVNSTSNALLWRWLTPSHCCVRCMEIGGSFTAPLFARQHHSFKPALVFRLQQCSKQLTHQLSPWSFHTTQMDFHMHSSLSRSIFVSFAHCLRRCTSLTHSQGSLTHRVWFHLLFHLTHKLFCCSVLSMSSVQSQNLFFCQSVSQQIDFIFCVTDTTMTPKRQWLIFFLFKSKLLSMCLCAQWRCFFVSFSDQSNTLPFIDQRILQSILCLGSCLPTNEKHDLHFDFHIEQWKTNVGEIC